jgi:hypothetical protein
MTQLLWHIVVVAALVLGRAAEVERSVGGLGGEDDVMRAGTAPAPASPLLKGISGSHPTLAQDAVDAFYFTPPQRSIGNVFIAGASSSSSPTLSSPGGHGGDDYVFFPELERTRRASHHVFLHQNKCAGTAVKTVVRAKKQQRAKNHNNSTPPINHAQVTVASACRAGPFEPDKFEQPWIMGGYASGVCDLMGGGSSADDGDSGGATPEAARLHNGAEKQVHSNGEGCHYFTVFRNPLFRLASAFRFCKFGQTNRNAWNSDQLCDSHGEWVSSVLAKQPPTYDDGVERGQPTTHDRFNVFVDRWSDFSVVQLAHTLGECSGKCDASKGSACWTWKMRSLGRPDLRLRPSNRTDVRYFPQSHTFPELPWEAKWRPTKSGGGDDDDITDDGLTVEEVPMLRTARRIAAGMASRFSVVGLQEYVRRACARAFPLPS